MNEQFQNMFAGNEERFLTFTSMTQRNDGKMQPDYRTVDNTVTEQIWSRHLKGDASLGLSPLRNGMVKWGAVDVDLYPFLDERDDILNFVEAWGDPCLVARTKSGGVHIIAFSKEWVPAERMRRYLEVMRDAILRDAALDNAREVFPKQDDGNGSQMNLPAFGDQRPALAWSSASMCYFTSDENPVDWEHVERDCFVSEGRMADVIMSALTPKPKKPVKKARERKQYAGGFKRPDASDGRRDFLFKCAASARARGAEEDQLHEIIATVNEEFANPDHEYARKGPITDQKRLDHVASEAIKFEKSTPSDLPFDMVEEMNSEWALMFVDGKAEVMQRATGKAFTLQDFKTKTLPRTYMANGKIQQMSDLWLRDPDRLEYDGIVIESPEYDGPRFNIFDGWACEPQIGDASLWEQYIRDVLCSGDEALAHWVMTFLADAVQRPWSLHPGSALALRGGQGAGKSFLGRAMSKLIGKAHAQEFAQSDRLFTSFNRKMFGSTFVLCEESLFAGSPRQANVTKSFITSDHWTYEQKYLASFDAKNVHRVIATTNADQAVHIDHDDRRWTVIEVPTRFEDHGPEARAWWEPYYRLIDDTPGIVLRYLLEYEVDRGLIQYGHITQAKAADKVASDPLLALLDEIAQTGVCPDDLEGRGCISSATLAREVYARGGNRFDNSTRLANQVRKKLGTGKWPSCTHISDVHRATDGNGILTVTPMYRKDRAGVKMPPLPEFRRIMSHITGEEYPEGEWAQYEVAGPGGSGGLPDPNGGDAEAFKLYAKENGKWDDAQIPF